jgi:oligopeptide transport system substrate-binding protein
MGTGHQQIAEALQDMWKKIGVNVKLVGMEWMTFLDTRKNGDFFIARNGWIGDYNDPLTFLDMYTSSSVNNDARWYNIEYDAIINNAKNTSDSATHFKLLHQAEDVLFRDWVVNPLYYYTDIYLLNPKVQSFWSSPLGFKYFMYATATK